MIEGYKKQFKNKLFSHGLVLETSAQCDDPGCYYFESIYVKTMLSKHGNPSVALTYDVFVQDPSFEQEDFGRQEKTIYFKK